ncbi:MAG: hypothetical protein GY929_18445 [Actinomycetia bacterium]|nr:hypothetical protein [Actinomycetes bacterium]
MAFGQSTGPAASHRQMAELLELLQQEGYDGYRDARGPMGFTQRQGNGKFTSGEADQFIAQLHQQNEDGGDPPQPVGPAKSAAKPAEEPAGKPAPRKKTTLRDIPDEILVKEMRRRGWAVSKEDG